MKTFIEFLAQRDLPLLQEYAEEALRIHEQQMAGQPEAPAQQTWYQKIGQKVMPYVAPAVAALALGGGIAQKANAAPQEPGQGQKAPTTMVTPKNPSSLDKIASISQDLDDRFATGNEHQQLKQAVDSGKVKINMDDDAHKHFVAHNPEYHPNWVKGQGLSNDTNYKIMKDMDYEKAVYAGAPKAPVVAGQGAKYFQNQQPQNPAPQNTGANTSPGMNAAQHFLKYAK
jgi:hypothetical protein